MGCKELDPTEQLNNSIVQVTGLVTCNTASVVLAQHGLQIQRQVHPQDVCMALLGEALL